MKEKIFGMAGLLLLLSGVGLMFTGGSVLRLPTLKGLSVSFVSGVLGAGIIVAGAVLVGKYNRDLLEQIMDLLKRLMRVAP